MGPCAQGTIGFIPHKINRVTVRRDLMSPIKTRGMAGSSKLLAKQPIKWPELPTGTPPYPLPGSRGRDPFKRLWHRGWVAEKKKWEEQEQKAKKKADRIRQVEEHKLVLQGKDAESVRQREMRAQKVRDENRKILLKKLRFRVIENGTVKALLDIIDTDRDGVISFKELKTALLRWNMPILPSDIRHYFNEMDTDKNGVVDLDELTRYLKPKKKTAKAASAPRLYGVSDRRFGWEERRAIEIEESHKLKYNRFDVDASFAQATSLSSAPGSPPLLLNEELRSFAELGV